MARFQIKHGENIEVATLSEIQALLAEQRAEDRRARVRVRAAEELHLDAGGSGQIELYTVPMGFELEVRRVTGYFTPGNAGNSADLGFGTGKTLEYLRSGQHIEYGQPTLGGRVQVPGVQTWGAEQGPYLVNGETFEVRAGTLFIGDMTVLMEGILARVKAQ